MISQTNNKNADFNDEFSIIEKPVKSHSPNLKCILEILPDAKAEYVDLLLQQNNNVVDVVLGLMLEKGYEKEVDFSKEKKGTTKIKINTDFSSASWKNSTTSSLYRQEALLILQNDFPFLKVEGIKNLFKKFNYHYNETCSEIEGHLKLSAQIYGRNFSHPRRIGEEAIAKMSNGLKILNLNVKSSIRQIPHEIRYLDNILKEEIDWIHDIRDKERKKKENQEKEILFEKKASIDGSLIECQCCYADCAFENMIQCTDGHLFCKGCLNKYAEESVFGSGKVQLKCMAQPDGEEACVGHFSESILRLCLSNKVFQKYEEALAKSAILEAKISNIVTCHGTLCQIKVEVPEDAGIILLCPECGLETCKLCGEKAHVPMKCQEAKDAKDTDVKDRIRIKAEEAMTKARLRECTYCKALFIKDNGCNKVVCPCGRRICYVCKKDISKEDYKHFCQIFQCKHEKCKSCPLYTDTAEDDKRAMLEAGLSAINNSEVKEGIMEDLFKGNDLDAAIQKQQNQDRLVGALNNPIPYHPLGWQGVPQGFHVLGAPERRQDNHLQQIQQLHNIQLIQQLQHQRERRENRWGRRR